MGSFLDNIRDSSEGMVLDEAEKLKIRNKELEEGIKKYLKKVVHSDGGYWECQEELKKLVEKK